MHKLLSFIFLPGSIHYFHSLYAYSADLIQNGVFVPLQGDFAAIRRNKKDGGCRFYHNALRTRIGYDNC